MPNWFTENAPSSGNWFSANAPTVKSPVLSPPGLPSIPNIYGAPKPPNPTTFEPPPTWFDWMFTNQLVGPEKEGRYTPISSNAVSMKTGRSLYQPATGENQIDAMTTPLNMAATAAPLMGKAVPVAGNILARGAGAIQAVKGAEDFYEGHPILGALNMIGGGLAARYGINNIERAPEVLPPGDTPAKVIPGKMRLGAGEQPRGYLPAPQSAESIPGNVRIDPNLPDIQYPELRPIEIPPRAQMTVGANPITVRGSTPPSGHELPEGSVYSSGRPIVGPQRNAQPGNFKATYDAQGNATVIQDEPPVRSLGKPLRYKVIYDANGNRQVVLDLSEPTTSPMNVTIPDRLKPVTPNESVMNALIPERYKPTAETFPEGYSLYPRNEPGGPIGNIEYGPTQPARLKPYNIYPEPEPVKPIQINPDGTTEFGYGGRSPETPQLRNYPRTERTVSVVSPGKEADKLIEAAKKVNDLGKKSPVVAEIVNLPGAKEALTGRFAAVRQFGRNWGMAVEKELANMGPAGRQLQLMLARASQTARQRASAWDVTYDQIAKQLKPDEMTEFWQAMNGDIQATNPKVKLAIESARKVDLQRTEMMQQAGLINPDTGELLQPRQNFTPRIYPEGFWQDSEKVKAALLAKYPSMDADLVEKIAKRTASPEMIDRVMASAKVDRNTAEAIVRIGLEQSERKIASQFSRTLDLPGYRTDINVWKEHNWDIARKTAEQEIFGRLDMADPNSPMSKLIEQTPNPQYTRELLKASLNRAERDRWARGMDKVNNFAANASAAMYLSMFPISNFSGLLATAVRGGGINTMKEISKVLVSARGETRALATEAGAMYNISRGILEAQMGHKTAKIFGINAAENFNRTVSAGVGRAAVRDLFETLKTGKLNTKNQKFLEDLTLSPIEDLLKQSELTESQLKFAGGRMAELTQGLAEARKVPIYWSSPYYQLPLIFKKYAFQTTAAIKDAIKTNPVKALSTLAVGSQIFGELTGDTKAAAIGGVKSLVTGNPQDIADKIARRGEYLGEYSIDNAVAQRLIDNALQSWALGLVGDAFFLSTGDARSMAYGLAGPAIGTALTGAEAAGKALSGDPEMLGREFLKRVPWFGRGLQEGLLPTKYQQNLQQRNSQPYMQRNAKP